MDTINILTIDIEATDSGSLEAVATSHAANPVELGRQAPLCRGLDLMMILLKRGELEYLYPVEVCYNPVFIPVGFEKFCN